jgi:ATP-binding cassette subfamily B protein
LSGVRVVRAYAQEAAEIEKFQELNREYARRNIALVKYGAAMRPLLFFFIGLGFVIIVAVGVPMAGARRDFGWRVYVFYSLLAAMIWYLIALGYVVNLYQRGTASLKAIQCDSGNRTDDKRRARCARAAENKRQNRIPRFEFRL